MHALGDPTTRGEIKAWWLTYCCKVVLRAAQVQFSPDGNYLYTGARRDPELFCWDVRCAADVVYRLERASGATNQRIQFDIEPCGRHLASGGGAPAVVACNSAVQ